MPIIRVSKNKKNPYFLMNKTGINDKRLSFKAKGLLSFFISKPDNWYIHYSSLARSGPDGIDSIKSAVKELISVGYIVRYHARDKSGKFTHYDYTIYEIPKRDKFKKNKSLMKSTFNKIRHVKNTKSNKNKSTPEVDFPRQEKPVLDDPVQVYNDKKEYNSSIPYSSDIVVNNKNAAQKPFLPKKNQHRAISLLSSLHITDHKKIFELFSLSDILKYCSWFINRNISVRNPTGFFITAIKEHWIDEVPDSAKPGLLVFFEECSICHSSFSYQDYEPNRIVCASCLEKERKLLLSAKNKKIVLTGTSQK